MTRKELATQNFLNGYNCSQSVVLAFSDVVNVDKDTLLRLAGSFGGGMGRLRETCGAVTGMFIIAGLLYGYSTPETGEIKADLYSKIQELAHRFEAVNGSIVCREILGLTSKHSSPVPEARTAEYYKKRPCPEIVGIAAEILENFIAEQDAAKQ